MELPADVRIPIVRDFYCHLYEKDWMFICGRGSDRELTKGNHHINAAFMDLDTSCQEILLEAARVTGEGMAKFLSKEIETMSDLEEYIGHASTSGMCAFLKLARILIGEDFVEESGLHATALLQHMSHCIHSYHEDMTDIPLMRMFWPNEIWRRYADKLEDFQYEVNSVKATQLLNEMITDVLSHVEATLDVTAKIKDPSLLRFMALPSLVPMGDMAVYYNNHQLFRKKISMRPDVKARIIDETKTMADVYGAFYDFSCLMESKVDYSDPHASQTLNRLEAIKQKCMDSGTLPQRNSLIFKSIQDIM